MSNLSTYKFNPEYEPSVGPIEVTLPFSVNQATQNITSTSVGRFLAILSPRPYDGTYSNPIDAEIDKWVGTLQDCLTKKDSGYVAGASDEQLEQISDEVKLLKPYSMAIGNVREEVKLQQPAKGDEHGDEIQEREILLTDKQRAEFEFLAGGDVHYRSTIERTYARLGLVLRDLQAVELTPELTEATAVTYESFSNLLGHYNEHGLIVPREDIPIDVMERLPDKVRSDMKDRENSFIGVAERKRRGFVPSFFSMMASDSETAGVANVLGIAPSAFTMKTIPAGGY